jgi:fimbrial chaperone protein
MRASLSCAVALLLATATMQPARAFLFAPFRAMFEPAGAGANQLFTVENNTDQPATVQIRITTRAVDVDGDETNLDDEKDFVIYPPQLVLEPHQKRSVRVQWVGDPALKDEKAYRIVAEQLPVNLSREKPHTSTVRFLVSYRGALFVTPPGLANDVTVDFAGATRDAAGRKMLELLLHNRGKRHALLRALTLVVKDAQGHVVTLAGDHQLQGVIDETILAAHMRRFLVPWPAGLGEALTHVEVKFDTQAF